MFCSHRDRAAYEQALNMHDTLARESSGRGMAYRRGWNGHPYDPTCTSYPVYRAGRKNRKDAGPDAQDLPNIT